MVIWLRLNCFLCIFRGGGGGERIFSCLGSALVWGFCSLFFCQGVPFLLDFVSKNTTCLHCKMDLVTMKYAKVASRSLCLFCIVNVWTFNGILHSFSSFFCFFTNYLLMHFCWCKNKSGMTFSHAASKPPFFCFLNVCSSFSILGTFVLRAMGILHLVDMACKFWTLAIQVLHQGDPAITYGTLNSMAQASWSSSLICIRAGKRPLWLEDGGSVDHRNNSDEILRKHKAF